ncbi:hypothetical protein MRX96_046032 [Rhipicephalus microplus]
MGPLIFFFSPPSLAARTQFSERGRPFEWPGSVLISWWMRWGPSIVRELVKTNKRGPGHVCASGQQQVWLFPSLCVGVRRVEADNSPLSDCRRREAATATDTAHTLRVESKLHATLRCQGWGKKAYALASNDKCVQRRVVYARSPSCNQSLWNSFRGGTADGPQRCTALQYAPFVAAKHGSETNGVRLELHVGNETAPSASPGSSRRRSIQYPHLPIRSETPPPPSVHLPIEQWRAGETIASRGDRRRRNKSPRTRNRFPIAPRDTTAKNKARNNGERLDVIDAEKGGAGGGGRVAARSSDRASDSTFLQRRFVGLHEEEERNYLQNTANPISRLRSSQHPFILGATVYTTPRADRCIIHGFPNHARIGSLLPPRDAISGGEKKCRSTAATHLRKLVGFVVVDASAPRQYITSTAGANQLAASPAHQSRAVSGGVYRRADGITSGFITQFIRRSGLGSLSKKFSGRSAMNHARRSTRERARRRR